MNKKGQMGVGVFITTFVVLVVGLAMLSGGVFQSVGTMTNTIYERNHSVTYSGTTVLKGQAVSNLIVINASDGGIIESGNYTVVNYDVSTGTLRAYLTNLTSRGPYPTIKVSYTYEPLGYDTNSGNRSIVGLIAVFAALAVAVVALVPAFREEVFNIFN